MSNGPTYKPVEFLNQFAARDCKSTFLGLVTRSLRREVKSSTVVSGLGKNFGESYSTAVTGLSFESAGTLTCRVI